MMCFHTSKKYRIQEYLAILAIFAVSLWLRAEFDVFGIWGAADDAHFVNLANKLRSGSWLGGYDPLTLSKGAFFPIFLAFTGALGLPLKMTEHLLYLLAAFLLAYTVMRVSNVRLMLLAVFCVLALSPLPWMIEGGSRVTREPLYQILTLLVFSLAVLHFVGDKRFMRGWVLGIVAALFWLTREEGVWLVPAIFILISPTLLRLVRAGMACDLLRSESKLLMPPLLAFAIVVLAFNSINWIKYGVFRNNDFRAGPFSQAYGAISRIKASEWQRYVVFPKDVRHHAYTASPAMQELAPYFEGLPGKQWAASAHSYPPPWGCVGRPDSCSSEILSAWFVWALRFGAAEAGYFRSAEAADLFFERVSREINQACDSKVIPCKPRRDSLASPWRGHYTKDTIHTIPAVFRTLAGFNQGSVGVPPSLLSQEQRDIFIAAVHQPLSGANDNTASPVALRTQITSSMARFYANVSFPLFWGALGIYLFMLFSTKAQSDVVPMGAKLFLSALLVAILTRVVLLSYLEVTAIPSNNLLYLMPAVPLFLAFVTACYVLGFRWAIRFWLDRRVAK